jgi:malate synthase
MSVRADPSDLPAASKILSDDALQFVAQLHRSFGARRTELLKQRAARRGEPLDFLPDTGSVRDGEWRVASAPADLVDRRVEMTGPTDRKMTINALNLRRSGSPTRRTRPRRTGTTSSVAR